MMSFLFPALSSLTRYWTAKTQRAGKKKVSVVHRTSHTVTAPAEIAPIFAIRTSRQMLLGAAILAFGREVLTVLGPNPCSKQKQIKII